MKKENYLPFDLETALKHPERVVTRDGRKVTQLTRFKLKEKDVLVAAFSDLIYFWRIDGKEYRDQDCDRDLFLLPEVKECWVNVYENQATGKLYVGCSYLTKYHACLDGNGNSGYIKTIRIDNSLE